MIFHLPAFRSVSRVGFVCSPKVLALGLGFLVAAPTASQAQFFWGRPAFGGRPPILSGRELAAVLTEYGVHQTSPSMLRGDVIVVRGLDRRGRRVRAVIDAYDGALVDMAYLAPPAADETAPRVIPAPVARLPIGRKDKEAEARKPAAAPKDAVSETPLKAKQSEQGDRQKAAGSAKGPAQDAAAQAFSAKAAPAKESSAPATTSSIKIAPPAPLDDARRKLPDPPPMPPVAPLD